MFTMLFNNTEKHVKGIENFELKKLTDTFIPTIGMKSLTLEI